MATASVTNNFVNGTTADADAVDQNFTDLVDFINGSVPHSDGDNGFTAVVSGIFPTSSAHLATKEYVDQTVVRAEGLDAIPAVVNSITMSTRGTANITIPATWNEYDIIAWAVVEAQQGSGSDTVLVHTLRIGGIDGETHQESINNVNEYHTITTVDYRSGLTATGSQSVTYRCAKHDSGDGTIDLINVRIIVEARQVS